MKKCIVEDCGKKHLARGYCKNHYYQFYLKNNNGINFNRNIKHEDSLEFFAMENKKEYLLKEFGNKNEFTPKEISRGSDKVIWWICQRCNSEYDMSVTRRTKGQNCPYCHGSRVNHTNCLWTTHPEIAKILLDPESGYQLTAGSNKKVNFKCVDCENIMQDKIVANVVRQGISCPKCSDGISYPEKFIFNVLSQLKVKFNTQKIFKWSRHKRYDFYIPTLNCIIEAHGAQHYSGNFRTLNGNSLKKEQENDMLKEKLAKENGIENYVIIDCRYSNLEHIKNRLINSKINELININNINWLECHEYSCKSLVKTTCALWNDGMQNTKKIANFLNMDVSTVVVYLKQGNMLGWCSYDPEVSYKKSIIGNQFNVRPVVQLSKGGDFIKEWRNITEVQRELGINKKDIVGVCKGKYGKKSAGGFLWVYKEDYNPNKKYIYFKMKKSKPIVQLTLNGEFIKEWESATEASKITGSYVSNIQSNCTGRYKSSGGFIWMYKSDYEETTKVT